MTVIPGDPPPEVDTDDPEWLGFYDEIGTARVGLATEVVADAGGGGGGGGGDSKFGIPTNSTPWSGSVAGYGQNATPGLGGWIAVEKDPTYYGLVVGGPEEDGSFPYVEMYAFRNSGVRTAYTEHFIDDGHGAEADGSIFVKVNDAPINFHGLTPTRLSAFLASESGSFGAPLTAPNALMFYTDVAVGFYAHAQVGQSTPLVELRDENDNQIFRHMQTGFSRHLSPDGALAVDVSGADGTVYLSTYKTAGLGATNMISTSTKTWLEVDAETGQTDPLFMLFDENGDPVFRVWQDGTFDPPLGGGGNQYGWYSDASYDPDTDTVAVTFTTPFGIDASTGIPYFDPGAVASGEEAVLLEDLSLVQPGK